MKGFAIPANIFCYQWWNESDSALCSTSVNTRCGRGFECTPYGSYKADVSVDRMTSMIKAKRISELGTALAVTAEATCEEILWWRQYVTPKRRFIQEPHGVTSQKKAFFIVTAVKTSNLKQHNPVLRQCTRSNPMHLLYTSLWSV
jgi:hypothetical protein